MKYGQELRNPPYVGKTLFPYHEVSVLFPSRYLEGLLVQHNASGSLSIWHYI